MTLSALGIFSAAGAGGAAFSSDYELISSTILGSSTPSVSFSSLGTYSSTYKHLQIRYTLRGDRASDAEGIICRLNGDSGNNYANHQLFGNGSSVGSGAQTSFSSFELHYTSAATTTANVFGSGVIDFLDAFSTTKNKTRRVSYSMGVHSGFSGVYLISGVWMNTAAITSIAFTPQFGSNWVTGSRFSLYGIKG
jgi:hypothetical protein